MSDVDAKIDRLLAELDRLWPGGYAALLFGSAARGQYIPGWSDINILVIASRLAPGDLRQAREALAEWRRSAEALPLLFTLEEWRRSADAYPLELSEMRSGYRVLRGDDPLAGMTVRPGDLRLALEREFRGKLMRLRQGYALFEPGSAELSEFLRSSASSVLLLCRGMLALGQETIPAEPAAVVHAAARRAGFAPEMVEQVVLHRAEEAWRATDDVVLGYLAAIEAAARFVDHFQIGART